MTCGGDIGWKINLMMMMIVYFVRTILNNFTNLLFFFSRLMDSVSFSHLNFFIIKRELNWTEVCMPQLIFGTEVLDIFTCQD